MDELTRVLRDLDDLKPAETYSVTDLVWETLPRRQAFVFLNYYLLGTTSEDLADLLHVRRETVWTYLSRARKTLRRKGRLTRARLRSAPLDVQVT